MRPVLAITGAGGTVGTALRPLLRADFRLRLLARRDIDSAEDDILCPHCDLSDRSAVFSALEGADAILHLAAAHGLQISFRDTLDANYHGTVNVMDAAVEHGIDRVVFASTNHGWGFHKIADAPITNGTPPKPDGWYGISKIWGEAVMAYYAEAHGISVTSLRIGHVNDHVPDERRKHMWTSYRDLARLITIVFGRKEPGHRAFFSTAPCDDPFFDNSGTDAFDFSYLDRPEDFPLKSDAVSQENEYLGGDFAQANAAARRVKDENA